METGVRLRHLQSGVMAQSADLRLRGENARRALRRLRERIAFEVRTTMDLSDPALPEELIRIRGNSGKLSVSEKNPSFPLVAATALDALNAAHGSYARASDALGVTTSQLLGFLKSSRELWREVDGLRARVQA